MIARNLIRLIALAVLAYLALPLVVILGSSFTACLLYTSDAADE